MFWDIDIKNGIVVYDDISFLPESSRPIDYMDFLKEDMLQIKFPGDITLDVSWRPSFQVKGKFYIMAIKNFDWEKPLASAEAADVSETKDVLRKIIQGLIV
jgi:hypothetical protein